MPTICDREGHVAKETAWLSRRRGVTATVTVVWIDAGLPPAGEIPAHPMTSDSAVTAKLTTAVGRQVKVHVPRPRRGPATHRLPETAALRRLHLANAPR